MRKRSWKQLSEATNTYTPDSFSPNDEQARLTVAEPGLLACLIVCLFPVDEDKGLPASGVPRRCSRTADRQDEALCLQSCGSTDRK